MFFSQVFFFSQFLVGTLQLSNIPRGQILRGFVRGAIEMSENWQDPGTHEIKIFPFHGRALVNARLTSKHNLEIETSLALL